MSRWLPIYGPLIRSAAAGAGIPAERLAALVWQETNGGIDARTGLWSPAGLYRYEAGWLRGHLNSEMLKLPVGMAQWREALCEYLDRISTQTAP